MSVLVRRLFLLYLVKMNDDFDVVLCWCTCITLVLDHLKYSSRQSIPHECIPSQLTITPEVDSPCSPVRSVEVVLSILAGWVVKPPMMALPGILLRLELDNKVTSSYREPTHDVNHHGLGTWYPREKHERAKGWLELPIFIDKSVQCQYSLTRTAVQT